MASFWDHVKNAAGDVAGGIAHFVEHPPGYNMFGPGGSHETDYNAKIRQNKEAAALAQKNAASTPLPPDLQKWVGIQAQAKTYTTSLTAMLQKSGYSAKDAASTAQQYVTSVWLPAQLATVTGSGTSSIGGDLTQLAKSLQGQVNEGVSQWNKAYQGDVNTAQSLAGSLKKMLPANYAPIGGLLDNVLQADRGVGDATAAQAVASPMNDAVTQLASRAFQQAYKNYLTDQQNLLLSTTGTGSTAANPFATP